MLTHLVIRNFAIIDHLEIGFDSGFTVLTGETGAGKSIIVDALNLILGGRASAGVIRADDEEAVVEASFYLEGGIYEEVTQRLEELGIELQERLLIIRRIINRSGRHKVFVNGSMATVTTLQELTHHLVDISGQHEHYSLMNESEHQGIVDNYGGYEEELAAYQSSFGEVRRLRKRLKELTDQVDSRLQQVDFMTFRLKELEAAKLISGEEESLEAEYLVLKNAEKVSLVVMSAMVALGTGGDQGATVALSEAIVQLDHATQYLPDVADYITKLKEVRVVLEDINHQLATRHHVEANPARLDAVQGRLEQLKRLRRKHGRTIEELIAYEEELRVELDQLENNEAWVELCETELRKAQEEAVRVGLVLSGARHRCMAQLAEEVMTNLAKLNMERSNFVIRNTEVIERCLAAAKLTEADTEQLTSMLSPHGLDDIRFYIAPNPGEPPKPIAKIASGGELSRIMLAIKRVLADRDNFSTYIFDEVDTGISGETADHVGEMIRDTAKDRQVLCITHLPQIASRADHHMLVEKKVENNRTSSLLRLLTEDGQIEEIARMLGGSRVSDRTLEAARELVQDGGSK